MNLVTPATHRNTQPPRPLIGYFVAGSLLLHALLVGLWQGKTPAGPSAHSTFQVTLLARHGDTASELRSTDRANPARKPEQPVSGDAAPASATLPASVEQSQQPKIPTETRQTTRLSSFASLSGITNRKRDARAEMKSRQVAAKETPPRAQQKQLSARNGSASHGRHELTSAARYRKTRRALQEALLPRFDYPPLARRRGWQGRVNVGLHVEADGDLTRIHLVQSSGHALLDGAAVKNITELRSIPRVAQWLEGHGMDMVLPVRYQLFDR